VELSCQWIKHHLRVKAFRKISGGATTKPAWIAISLYVHLATAQKALPLDPRLAGILHMLSIIWSRLTGFSF
jgi:hypothetical protein